MARGELTLDAQARIAAAVASAERHTGLELCVVFCRPGAEQPRRQAEQAFTRLGLTTRPGVLIMVMPKARRVEIVTSAALGGRITDADCSAASAAMVACFAGDDFATGVEAGLAVITERGGAGKDAADQNELPDIVEA